MGCGVRERECLPCKSRKKTLFIFTNRSWDSCLKIKTFYSEFEINTIILSQPFLFYIGHFQIWNPDENRAFNVKRWNWFLMKDFCIAFWILLADTWTLLAIDRLYSYIAMARSWCKLEMDASFFVIRKVEAIVSKPRNRTRRTDPLSCDKCLRWMNWLWCRWRKRSFCLHAFFFKRKNWTEKKTDADGKRANHRKTRPGTWYPCRARLGKDSNAWTMKNVTNLWIEGPSDRPSQKFIESRVCDQKIPGEWMVKRLKGKIA